MNIIKRKAEKKLEDWYRNRPDKHLYVTGLRGTGKSTLIRHFADSLPDKYIYIDFETDNGIRTYFREHFNNDFISALSGYAGEGVVFSPGMILILDEIHMTGIGKDILASLSALDNIRVILIDSEGVTADALVPADISRIILRPLTFDEFLDNTGKEWYKEVIIGHYEKMRSVPSLINNEIKDIFDDYRSGGLGSNYNNKGQTATQTANAPSGENPTPGDAASDDNSALLGENATAAAPNSTTGATMALDVGSAYGNYQTATSHEELLTQLDQALAANDTGFVGMKLSYEDEESKSLIGYPESVVEHFTKYMSENPDKRATFLAEIKDEATFSAKNGSAYLVKLPLLQFTINMGYDGTTISISGFSDQKMDKGQSAVVSPLLPCMYTIHAETATGEQTSEIECNMNEGNLKINIGVTN